MDYIKKFFLGNKRTVAVKKNAIYSMSIKGFSIFISLLIVPMTLSFVSKEVYGIWLTLSSMVMWLNFFDIGFTLGLKNKLTEAIACGDWDKGKALVSTTYFMMLIIFIPICIVLMFMVPYVDWATFLNVNSIYNSEIRLALYVLSISFCIQMILNVITSVAAAFQQIFLSSLVSTLGNFISLIIIYFLPQICKPSMFALACVISVAPAVVTLITSIIFFRKRYKCVSPNFRYINMAYVSEIFSLGLMFFIIQIQVVVLYQTTNILISKLSGPEMVTEYSIAYKYISVALMFFNIILSPLWPAFTDAYTRKDYTWMRSIYSKMQKVWIMSLGGIMLMVIFSPVIYNIWIGGNVNVSWGMTVLVAIYVVINSWDSLQVTIINGIGSIKLQTCITLGGMLIHIPLSYLVGNKIGLNGYGVIVSMIFITMMYSVFFTIQVNKLLKGNANGVWK